MNFLSKRLEEFLFYLLLIAVPLQLRRVIYYPGWSFNEWLSASIYITDLILVVLFCFWLWRLYKKESKFIIEKYEFVLLSFAIISTLSIIQSPLKFLSFFNCLKIVEFVIFYFYFKNYALPRFGIMGIALSLLIGGLFQSIIAIGQFALQSSLGFWWLGEGIISSNLAGIAVFYNSVGDKIVRAYGTTPHPNILAGYLLVSLAAVIYLWHSFQNLKDKKLYRLLMVSYSVILLAFLFTFSRTAIFVWAVSLASFGTREYLYDSIRWPSVKKLLIITVIICSMFALFYWPEALSRVVISGNEEAVELRIYFAQEAVDTGWNWLGVGSGNFVNWLMDKNPGQFIWRYQPVHNLYLLIYTETGIIGAVVFGSFLFCLLFYVWNRKDPEARHYSLIIMGAVLFMAFFDHFLWTLQQGHFIFWGVLAVVSYANLTR